MDDLAEAEPESLEAKTRRLRKHRRSTLAGRDQAFGIFRVPQSPTNAIGDPAPDETEIMGAIGTHLRIGAGAREIGYWIGAAHVRQGYTSEAVAALVKIGIEVQQLRRMEIHTDPGNLASAGVARALGFRLQIIVQECVLSLTSPVRDDALWALSPDEYPTSRAASMPIEAFERGGKRVL
jgi:RimJ/RimL family protein N-acetyltransferase